MPSVKLTDAVIATSMPQEKLYDLNDIETPGLQCVINPKGKKTFKLRVKNFEKRIGVFPVIKCAEARKIALMWYGELLKGGAPGKKEEAKTKELTLDSLIQEYLNYKTSGRDALAASTFYDYQWTWKKYISPALGDKLISTLTDADINNYLISLKETYSHIKTSRIILKPALEYGESLGYSVYPVRPTKWIKFKTHRKERYFTPGELKNLRKILAKTQEKQLVWGTHYQQTLVLELLIYTGCRCGEILNLKWDDVFLEEGYIQLWKTKTKKGRVIPIVPLIKDIFLKIPRKKDAPFVFSSERKPTHSIAYTTLITLWLDFVKKGGFNNNDIERLTIHSLRHTFITVANRTGISPWTIQTLVGHSLGKSITGLYIHHNLKELREALEKIIENLTGGNY